MALILDRTAGSADGQITADGNVVFDWSPKRVENPARATVFIWGNFDSGTVSLQASADGVTFITLLDQTGNAAQYTADTVANFELESNGNPIAGQIVQVRLNLAGSTSPVLNYRIFDRT